MATLKNACGLVQVNPRIHELLSNGNQPEVRLEAAFKAELDEQWSDEQWSYVGSKANQRWLWYVVDHATNVILAYVFDKRKGDVFKQLKALLEPFGITRYYTDDWGAYERYLDSGKH